MVKRGRDIFIIQGGGELTKRGVKKFRGGFGWSYARHLVVLVIFMLFNVQMLVKPCVPSDKLEGGSVVNSVVYKLFVECFYGVFVLVS